MALRTTSLLCFTTALCIGTLYHHTQSTAPMQYSVLDLERNRFDIFWQQPSYSKASIKCFLKQTYNSTYYAQRFLSFNFSHMHTLLGYAPESEKPRAYLTSVLGLFSQKLKSATYINAYALSELLELLPPLLKDYCAKSPDKKEALKECLYNFLLNDFAELKKNPETCIDTLATKLHDLCIEPVGGDLALSDLQNALMKFLEVTLSRLIWSPVDHEEVWRSLKEIAHKLEVLVSTNSIPNTESLDELYWTLIHRFCYFLQVAGAELKPECYEVMHQDLNTQKLSLWSLSERESYITTKSDHLKSALVDAHIRSKAFSAGLITDFAPAQ